MELLTTTLYNQSRVVWCRPTTPGIPRNTSLWCISSQNLIFGNEIDFLRSPVHWQASPTLSAWKQQFRMLVHFSKHLSCLKICRFPCIIHRLFETLSKPFSLEWQHMIYNFLNCFCRESCSHLLFFPSSLSRVIAMCITGICSCHICRRIVQGFSTS